MNETTTLEKIKVSNLNQTQLKTIAGAIDRFVADKRTAIDKDMYDELTALSQPADCMWEYITSPAGKRACEQALTSWLADKGNAKKFLMTGCVDMRVIDDAKLRERSDALNAELSRKELPVRERHKERIKTLIDAAECLKLNIALSTCPNEVREAIAAFKKKKF